MIRVKKMIAPGRQTVLHMFTLHDVIFSCPVCRSDLPGGRCHCPVS